MQSGTVNAPWSYLTLDTAKANSLAVIDYVECDSKQVLGMVHFGSIPFVIASVI